MVTRFLVSLLVVGTMFLNGCVVGPYYGNNPDNSGAPTAEFSCRVYPELPSGWIRYMAPAIYPYPRYLDATLLDSGVKEAWVRCDASASYDPVGASMTGSVRALYVDGYHWDFGDGSFGSGVVATHSYREPGAFNVTLTVFDDSGHQTQAQRTAIVLLGALSLGTIGLTWDGSQLWVSESDMLYRVNPNTGTITQALTPPVNSLRDITWDGTHLWAISAGTIYKMAPKTAEVVHSIPAPEVAEGLTWDGSNLWVAAGSRIYKINPETGEVIHSIPSPVAECSGLPCGLVWDGAHLWISHVEDQQIFKVDPGTGDVVDSLLTPSRYPFFIFDWGGPVGLAWDGHYLWVGALFYDDVIYKVDPNTGEIVAP